MATRELAFAPPWTLAIVAAVAVAACGGGQDGPPDAMAPADSSPSDAPATGNSTLAALASTAGVLDPPFEPELTEYDLDLVLAEPDLAFTVTAALADSATITVDGGPVASGDTSPLLSLAPGTRDVDIVVVADDGAATTYRVHVHRGVDVLASLAPSSGALVPSFEPATTTYALDLPVATSTTMWTPTLLTPGRASITVDGIVVASGSSSAAGSLLVGADPLQVVITPQTRPARTYDLNLFRGIDALASITLSSGGGTLTNPLTPVFDPITSTYAVHVDLWVQRVQVTVVPLSAGATMTVGGGPASSGIPSTPISLNLGLTSIPVVVTASGGAQRTYTLNVTRAAPLQEAYIKASNTESNDGFGGSPTGGDAVALWGDTLVVAAPSERSAATGIDGAQADNSAGNSGAVYVFTRSGTSWSQQAYIKASNTGAGDGFGSSVALWGDTLVVGAYCEASAATGVEGNQADNSAGTSGAAYVFTRTGTTWSQQAYLKASNTGAGDYFGRSVAVSGDTVAVGASAEGSAATGIDGNQADNGAAFSGAVYVFTRTGSTWAQQAYVKASNTGAFDSFGSVIALWGDTLAVTAYGEDSAAVGVGGDETNNSASGSGAAYVFTRTGATWSQQAYVKASNAQANDRFGDSVALWGDTLAIGAVYEASAATGVGGDQTSNAAAQSGAAYVFTRTGTAWSQQAYVKASNTQSGDWFGRSVALWGDILAVGSGDDSAATGLGGNQFDESAADSGAVYVLTRTGTGWSQQSYVKASNTGANDRFGEYLALHGDCLAATAPSEDSAAIGVGGTQLDEGAWESGATYVFR